MTGVGRSYDSNPYYCTAQLKVKVTVSPLAIVPSTTPLVLCRLVNGTVADGQPSPVQATGSVQIKPVCAGSRTTAPVTVSGPLLVTTRV